VTTRTQPKTPPWKCGPPGSLSSAVAGGFVAGIAAAVALILTRVVLALGAIALLLRLFSPWHAPVRVIVEREVLTSLKVAAHPFVGERVYRPELDLPVVLLAFNVVLVFSIATGVLFALVARGLSRMATCAVALAFGFVVWLVDMLILNPSPATVIEAVPSGLALACTFLWYERRLSMRGQSGGRRRHLARA